jgi:hypothetical protein
VHHTNSKRIKRNKTATEKVVYDYDLISGNVKQVTFISLQKTDQFIHHFYDADNRIQQVYTSRDNVIWEKKLIVY